VIYFSIDFAFRLSLLLVLFMSQTNKNVHKKDEGNHGIFIIIKMPVRTVFDKKKRIKLSLKYTNDFKM